MSRVKSRGDAHPITQLLSIVTLMLVLLFFAGSAAQIRDNGVIERFIDIVTQTTEARQ